jgi:DNA-binding NarL/FixJ family response regulator
MLRDIVQSVLGERGDIELTTVAGGAGALAASIAARGADVVIVAEGAPNADAYAALLYTHPRLRLVAISGDGRDAHLYELRPQRIPLGALSPESLVEIVRARHAASAIVDAGDR